MNVDVNAQFCYWERPKLRVLSDRQREIIYLSALEVLERTGARLYSPRAVALLQEAGAIAIDDHLVKIPSGVVQNAVASAGKRLTLADRSGARKILLEGDNVYFGPGSDNPSTIDLETGERRTSVLKDVERAARLADALPNIDFLMSFALASDVPSKAADACHFEAMVANSTKPITATAPDLGGLKAIYEIACAVSGGEARFRQNPFFILYEQPHSPLKHADHSLEKLIFCTEKGIPVLYASTPSIGAASPVTLGGSFVLNMAEYLTALVLVQHVKKGATLVFGGGPTTLDMRTTVYSYSAPETMLSLCVRKELGEYLGIPVFNAGGFSDSQLPDQQAALECATSLIHAAMAGGNLVHDVGYLASGMTSSLEMLAICDEQIAQIKRVLRSFKVDAESLAVDLIDQVGPEGDFLATDLTLNRFREEIWSPTIIDRSTYDHWAAAGSTTLRDRARDKAQELLKNHEPACLPEDVRKEVRAIVKRYEQSRA
jgi:trimethylamine---corrinoid protein Co-methyltransferase